MKRFLQCFLYGVYWAAVLMGVVYLFHFNYVAKFSKNCRVSEPPLELPFSTNRDVPGKLKINKYVAQKKSSFFHFDERKEASIIRMGCFGDSYTWADDVSGNVNGVLI